MSSNLSWNRLGSESLRIKPQTSIFYLRKLLKFSEVPYKIPTNFLAITNPTNMFYHSYHSNAKGRSSRTNLRRSLSQPLGINQLSPLMRTKTAGKNTLLSYFFQNFVDIEKISCSLCYAALSICSFFVNSLR